jgi:hypothetical protein
MKKEIRNMKLLCIICIAGFLVFSACKEHHSVHRNESAQVAAGENNNMNLQVPVSMNRKGIQLSHPELFPDDYKAPARLVAKELRKDKANPQEFYVEIEPTLEATTVRFQLWHEDAFKKENEGVLGNPGGKCRTFYYDLKQGRITKKLFWR